MIAGLAFEQGDETMYTDLHGLLGRDGYARVRNWGTASQARARSVMLLAEYRSDSREVVKNVHLSHEWAQAAVRAPRLLSAVRGLLGDSVAVENTFLVIKWPGRSFSIPWHQDGINDGLVLDPGRSVAAWLALTDALPDMGCLRVVPGSPARGYMPYEAEPATGATRGRALGVVLPPGSVVRPVPVRAGDGLLMDPRLLHSSGPNLSDQPRIGLNIRYVAPDGCVRRDSTSSSLYPLCGTGW